MPALVEIHTADGIYIRQGHFPQAGSAIAQHAHRWDHTTMVARGALRVFKNDRWHGDFTAPTGIFIEAGTEHCFVTLVPDTTIYCIHNLNGKKAVEVLAENGMTLDDARELMRAV